MAVAEAIWGKQTITILNGATVSDAADGGPYIYFGLQIPAAFTGTTITFQVSADGVTYQPLYDSSNVQVSLTVAPGRSYDLTVNLRAWPYFKVVSGSAEAAQRTLIVTKN